jgi:Arc/MetJ family transcription regulator
MNKPTQAAKAAATTWSRLAVTHLLQRLTARAARDLEAQAGELLEAARALRGGA